MFFVNEVLDSCGEANDDDISELVPIETMKNDLNFYNYMCTSNNK